MLFSNCKPVRINHGEFKDSDFDDDRQPDRKCIGPRNRKHLYDRSNDRHCRNSNDKFGIFDHEELGKCRQVIATTTTEKCKIGT